MAVALVTAGSSFARTTNLVQLDDGTCGRNLQIGSDRTASSSATPQFLLWGDGGASSYQMFIDGVSIGNFTSDGWGNVCVRTTVPLSDGPHTLTGNELAPHNTYTVTPLNFSVDTVPPATPTPPVISGYSDSGVVGDHVTMYRNVNFTGTSDPSVSIQLYNGPTGIAGARADATGHWSATTSTLNSGNYNVTAAAFDQAGNKSPLSVSFNLTVDATAPTGPITSPADGSTVSGTTNVTVDAADGSGVSKVDFKIDGVVKSTATATPWTFAWNTGSVANGTHTVSAVTTDVAGNTATSTASVTVQNGVGAAVPAAPAMGSATGGNGSVSLSWSAPSSDGGSAITGYKIYRGTTSSGETALATVGNVTSYTDTAASNGTTYYYKVSAVNAIGESALSTESSATPATVPGAPTLGSATAGNGTVALAWTAPASNGGSAVTGYKVYRGTTAGGETLLASVGVGSSYTDGTALNGVTYFYVVSAVNARGESVKSNERSATPSAPLTVPGAATLNSAVTGDHTVTLGWSAPASDGGTPVTGYVVYRGTVSGALTQIANLVSLATGYTDSSALNGTTYYYAVAATNLVGEGAKSNERSATPVAAATAPAAPTLNALSAGNGTVNLSWSAPAFDGGSAVTGYRLYRGTTSGGQTLLATVGTGTSYADSTATNGTTYFYKVSAVNAVGEGAQSNERSATPATTPGAPTLTSATSGNGTVSLSWSAPSSTGGSPVTGYRVYRGTTSGGETLLAGVGTGTSYTDAGLANGTTYYYKVTALNAVGEGPLSGERSATPASAPGAPALTTATAGNGSVALGWTAPASSGGSAVTGYRVYRSTTSGAETLLTTVGTVTGFTDTAAVNGTTYFYKVSALNAIGEGALSNERSATPATTPGAPTLTAATAGNSSVALTWSAPASTGGSAVTAYRVYRGTAAGTETFFATVTTGTSFTDTSAANGTTYYYEVTAVNAVGEGSFSNERSATPSTVPGSPALNAATAGNGTVALTWSAPASTGGSALTGYRVYRGTASGSATLLANVGTGTTYTDTTAANGTTYYYTVSALNASGEGLPSNERSATPATTPGAPTLTAAAGGNGSVALTWTAPASNGGSALTGYRVYRSTTSGSETLLTTVGAVAGYTDTTTVNGTTYFYKVSAVNSVGESLASNERSATPATTPGAPTLTAATAGTATVALAWTAPASNGGSALTGYRVYRGTSSGNETLLASVGTGTTYTDTTAANGTTYFYKVSAVNSVGESLPSNERSATPIAVVAPAAPTLMSATPGNSVTLTWSAPASDGGSPVTGYRIYRSTTSGAETFLLEVGNVTTYTDETTVDGTTYYFQVSAVNAAGEGPRSGELFATPAIKDTTAPSRPSGLRVPVAGTTQAALAWSASTDNVGVTGYQVYRDGVLVTKVSGTTYLDSGLAPGSSHTYTVRAVDAAGNGSQLSSSTSVRLASQGTGLGVLSGVVFTTSGATLRNAIVSLTLKDGSVKTTKSGNSGVWKLTSIPAGTYTVTASLSGFPARTMTLTAVSGQTVLGLVTLG